LQHLWSTQTKIQQVLWKQDFFRLLHEKQKTLLLLYYLEKQEPHSVELLGSVTPFELAARE
jgi:hypothetical protein